MTGSTKSEWLEQMGLAWLRALEDETGFDEGVLDGVAIRGSARTAVTQSRLGYCWSRLAVLYPHQPEFARGADKSFRVLQEAELAPAADEFRVYDHSFFLLFMSWFFRLTGEPEAIRRLRARYSLIEQHLDNAGAGGFGAQPAGIRSHNPYMHLLETLLSAFHSTRDEYWLAEARKIETLFFERLLDKQTRLVFEFLNPDWSIAGDGRIEIGHQLEWATLLLELHAIAGRSELVVTAEYLHEFALRCGFEDGLAISAVNSEGAPTDRAKLLWVQTEAVRRRAQDWNLIRGRFFHPNGWSWYNRLTAEGTPIDEPSNARLLYHVVSAAAEAV